VRPEKYQIYVNNLFVRSDDPKDDEFRVVTGVTGEWGEVCDLLKKSKRPGWSQPIDEWREEIELEIGDTLFYLAHLCNYLDLDLGEVMDKNIAKLDNRRNEGTILQR
jgi:NTP pyrophosphatase (non-canonical NTP hydrolase)